MPREFRFAGIINDNTNVLGTTYGHVKELIKAGFGKQFELIEAAKRKNVLQTGNQSQVSSINTSGSTSVNQPGFRGNRLV
jgi:hypothetical protein